jgi:hypothetical protein
MGYLLYLSGTCFLATSLCFGTWLPPCGTTEVVPFPVVALPESSEGWGCGIPPFAKCAKDGAPSFVVVLAYSRFLTGLSARFGMTRFQDDVLIFSQGWL